MTKAEQKTAEKITLSAYAKHLADGIVNGSYNIEDAKGYWKYAQTDPAGFCKGIELLTPQDSAFSLLSNYQVNVNKLVLILNENEIEKAIKQFPVSFGLKGFEGTFHINTVHSYIASDKTVLLYVFNSKNQAFCKCTISELREQIVTL